MFSNEDFSDANVLFGTADVEETAATNIAAISDGKQDDNYAVHNSTGERWLQFEYKNRYRIHEVSSRAPIRWSA